MLEQNKGVLSRIQRIREGYWHNRRSIETTKDCCRLDTQGVSQRSGNIVLNLRWGHPLSSSLRETQDKSVREVANGTNAQGNPVTVFVAVPIKPTELRELKRTLPKLHENAHEVAEQLELFLGPSEYTYPELMYILGHLFTPEERNLIRRAAMAAWDRRQAGQQGAVAANVKFPIADPNWDLNDAGHRELMRDVKRMILEDIKLAIPQGKNLTKAFEVTQGKEESPGDFCARLRESLTKYSGVEPETPALEALLKLQFVTKAWPDIQRKIQKNGWVDRNWNVRFNESSPTSLC
ncbi:hypothetical protein E2320_015868 [Naja naja]|nr:hypothetical protein E2320_015868 [Naja naja]